MPALSRSTPRQALAPQPYASLIPVRMAAGQTFHAGAMIALNAAGYGVNVTSGTVADASLRVVGVYNAYNSVTNAGLDGEVTVNVERRTYKFASLGGDAVTQAHQLAIVYGVDNNTIAATDGAGTRPKAARVVQVDADGAWVEFGFTS